MGTKRIDSADTFADNRVGSGFLGAFITMATIIGLGMAGGVVAQNVAEHYMDFDESDLIGAGVGAFVAMFGVAGVHSLSVWGAARSGYLHGAWGEQDGNH